MSFLPIVGRELRGASRRRGTYWMRTVVAFLAVLTGTVIFVAIPGTPGSQSGRVIFEGLSGLALLYCLASGRALTVDCLSAERREGTLGLLFLTDLKGYDVVLGKLVATSLNGFFSLLAVMPVLALCMLLGGVSNAEFWRMVLVLADTFLFSLAVGIFCSSLNRDARRAAAANFGLLLLFIGVLPSISGIVTYFAPSRAPIPQLFHIPQLFYACPGCPFFLSFDALYKRDSRDFWWSLGVMHALTWSLVLFAGWIVPRTWQDQPVRTKKARLLALWDYWNFGPASGRVPYRKRMLDTNAFYWLTARARFKPLHVWVFLAFMAGWWAWSLIRAGDVWWSAAVAVGASLILNSTFKLWITLEAGQQLAEDQQMGTLELLLPTPLGARDILRGQWLALRRQFLRPLLVIIAAELILTYLTLLHQDGDSSLVPLVLAGTLALIADSLALAWLSMRLALTARSASRALIGAVVRILVLPWAGFGVTRLVIGVRNILWPEKTWEPDWHFDLGLWFSLGIAADLFFGLIARYQLLHGFHRLAMHRFERKPSRLARLFSPAADAGQSATAAGSVRVPWRRRLALAVAAVLVLVAAGFLLRQHKPPPALPPPVVVSIAQSNTPLFILPGQETMMVLPDGALWRWGDEEQTQTGAGVPQQFGRGRAWTQVHGYFSGGTALQQDGTLWAWGNGAPYSRGPGISIAAGMVQIDPGHDWLAINTAGADSLAIKKDGSLWSLDRSSTNQFVQVGADHDWKAVRSLGAVKLAIRNNGTLWSWGNGYLASNGATRMIQVVTPTQMCRETNWAGFPGGMGYSAWTASGELWQFSVGAPNAQAGIASFGRLITTNYRPGRLAFAAGRGGPMRQMVAYELRADGTLWEGGSAYTLRPGGIWSRVGSRSDWLEIWGGAATGFGLTADGTIWTWGVDRSQKPQMPFSARLRSLQDQIARTFNPSATGSGIGPTPVFQDEPRPLMRLVTAGTNQPASLVNAADSAAERH
jgi:hypothetical protein